MILGARCGPYRRRINLTISANQTALYNVYTAASSPTDEVDVVVTVNSGVEVRNAMTLGTTPWAAGTTIRLINHGTIAGIGGRGGEGGHWLSSGDKANGQNGVAGGNALTLNHKITIDNTDGFIFGGGGGGGGGAGGGTASNPTLGVSVGGGGGGGGQHLDSSNTFGVGGVAAGLTAGDSDDGSNGNNGTSGGAGTGGSGGSRFDQYFGGDGGTGGAWGTAGSNGEAASGCDFFNSPGNGGAAGKAVNLNGHTVTWRGGNDGTHVRGAVS